MTCISISKIKGNFYPKILDFFKKKLPVKFFLNVCIQSNFVSRRIKIIRQFHLPFHLIGFF